MRCLFLMVNNLCNISCAYCFYATGYQKRVASKISPDKAEIFADKIEALNFDKVILTGGEPLHLKLKQETYIIIREIKKKKIPVIINTSATFLTDADLDTIIRLNVDRIDISIDSHIREVHNKQRGRFDDTVYAIKGLISRGYRNVATTTVVTKKNASTLDETINWLQGLGISDIRFQEVFIPKGKMQQLNTENKDNIIFNAIKKISQKNKSTHIKDYIALTEAIFNNKNLLPNALCCMGKEYFVCSAEGDLTPCFHRPDIKLGNLFNDPVSEIIANIDNNILSKSEKLPNCFGVHCVSLFDNPRFWK
ncbi:MAG: radical SAM protein [Patescibacteria group bacterium]|nr:radical SAM protein [Patescibacteria group bacterium]